MPSCNKCCQQKVGFRGEGEGEGQGGGGGGERKASLAGRGKRAVSNKSRMCEKEDLDP